ncbi:hypothetical protein [Kitasatospora sp. NBC_01300]|uniref:hypothetical protein n=1 Tax=Kitasatospora sp. NBC_01300 TaxID=2903574 RepID=UPI002F91796E|nr:hypothetical protein OG556_34345 [Kitasatospora sp. NBC_01300]
MSVFLSIIDISALCFSEAVAVRRHPDRSFLLLLRNDRVALAVVLVWRLFSVAVSVPDGNILGGSLFGLLSACVVGCTVATARRARARRRVARHTT